MQTSKVKEFYVTYKVQKSWSADALLRLHYTVLRVDRCDVAPSVAIVVLIRGGPHLQTVPVIGSADNAKNLRPQIFRSPHSALSSPH